MQIDLTAIVAAIREHAGALNNLAAAIREGGTVSASDVSTDAAGTGTATEGTKAEGGRKRRTKAEIAAEAKAAADAVAANQELASAAALAAAAAAPGGGAGVDPAAQAAQAVALAAAQAAQAANEAAAQAQAKAAADAAALAQAQAQAAAPAVDEAQRDFDKLRATLTGWTANPEVGTAFRAECQRFALTLPLSNPANPEEPGSLYRTTSPAVRQQLQSTLEASIAGFLAKQNSAALV